LLRSRLLRHAPQLAEVRPVHRDFRPGDVMHSQADIAKAARLLGYAPSHDIGAGLDAALPWYIENL
jgi:UDP-N-acetylglucosamine 4-epimerase